MLELVRASPHIHGAVCHRRSAAILLDEQFRPETLQRLAELRREDYYINMALAWYFSYALIKQYEFTLPLFQRQTLSPWVHNKALQKAVESRRIAPEIKAYLRTLRC